MDDQKVRACPLQECRGRPRCAQCKMLDEMYPPQRNLSGRGDSPSDAEATIPTARLIELETAEHERDILRTENAALKREAHTWSKAAEQYAKPRQPLTREQIDAVMTEHYPLSSLLREEVDAFERCVRDIERLHGIGA